VAARIPPSTKVNSVEETALPPALRSGSPALFKRTIALSLRRWRTDAGLAQKDGAKRVGRTTQHISNLESGQLPTAGDLELLLGLYGKEDRIPFMRELLSAAREATDWWTSMSGAVPKWFDLYLGLESGAAKLSSFDSVVVPGLLQTQAYAIAVIQGDPDLSAEQIQKLVDVRMSRQRILEGSNPVEIRTVIDESVLHRMRGGPDVMREQLAHLLEISERPSVDIKVLPFDAGASSAQDSGTFVVMNFPPEMEDDPGLVYFELLTGGKYLEKPEEVEMYKGALTRLHGQAASSAVSRGIIERRMKEVSR
jgi:DNA-binding XRE family transcriptional regulator